MVPIGNVVEEEKIFEHFSMSADGGHLGLQVGSSDTILKGDLT